MRHFILYVLLFSSIAVFGMHKDEVFINRYGNVKTLVKTGFMNYGSTIRMELLGKMAEKLCQKLAYTDTIVIEFKHDYTHTLSPFLMVEHGNPSSLYLLCHDIEEFSALQNKSHSQINGKSALCIRTIDTDISIESLLKIIEYGISNSFINNSNQQKCKSTYYLDNNQIFTLDYLGMKQDMLKEIIASKTSSTIQMILNEPIVFYNKNTLLGTFKNDTYHFENLHVKYDTKTLEYLVPTQRGLFIFSNKNDFIYLNEIINTTQQQEAQIPGNYAFLTYSMDPLNPKTLLGDNNILLYRYNIRKRIVFSESENKIIKVRE